MFAEALLYSFAMDSMMRRQGLDGGFGAAVYGGAGGQHTLFLGLVFAPLVVLADKVKAA